MLALDLTSFEDGRLQGPARLVEKFGWYRGTAFLDWLHDRVAAKLGLSRRHVLPGVERNPCRPPGCGHDPVSPYVTTRGGAYCYLPSITAIRYLAAL